MEEKIIDNEIKNEEVSLKELILRVRLYYRYLLSKWIIILVFAIVGGGLGLIASLYKKPVYIASTSFVLEESESGGGGLGQYAGIASMVGIDVGGGSGGIFKGDNIIELYKSRNMIEKTLLSEADFNGKKKLLIDRYIDFNRLREKWNVNPALKSLKFALYNASQDSLNGNSRLRDSVLGVIAGDINKNYLTVSKPDKKLSIIEAVVRSKDEVFAKVLDEQIVKNVNDFYVRTKTKKSKDNIAIIQKKTDSVRAVMNGAIYSAAAITDATPNLNITRQVQRSAPVQRSQFSAETNKSILAQLVQTLELSKISLLKETPLIQVIDQPVFPLEKDVLSKKKGIFIGFFAVAFLSCLYFLIKKVIKDLMI